LAEINDFIYSKYIAKGAVFSHRNAPDCFLHFIIAKIIHSVGRCMVRGGREEISTKLLKSQEQYCI